MNDEGVKACAEVAETFPMPALDEYLEVEIMGEPFIIETPKSKYNKTAVKMKVKLCQGGLEGEIFLARSLMHNYAVALEKRNLTETEAIGKVLRIFKEYNEEDGNNYYGCRIQDSVVH